MHNDTDPDTNDTVNLNSVDSNSGGTATAIPPAGVAFADDGTLGGQFSYDVTDGLAISDPATVTFDNNPSTATSLGGTSGDDIIIGDNAGESLDGGTGNDILISSAGNQTLTGGSGNDIFAFQQPRSSPSTEFKNTTEQDQIAVSAAGFGGGLTPGMDLSPLFNTSGDNQFASADSRFHFDTG